MLNIGGRDKSESFNDGAYRIDRRVTLKSKNSQKNMYENEDLKSPAALRSQFNYKKAKSTLLARRSYAKDEVGIIDLYFSA